MHVKHLRQLDIRSNYRNHIALSAALRLCWAEPPQRLEYMAADNNKQLERDIVVFLTVFEARKLNLDCSLEQTNRTVTAMTAAHIVKIISPLFTEFSASFPSKFAIEEIITILKIKPSH